MRVPISFQSLLVSLWFLGVIILAIQPMRTIFSSDYQGVLYKGGDESQYVMRITQATHHPFSEVSNAITSVSGERRGLQMSFFEMLTGSLFSWTGLSGPVLAILLSVLIAPLTLPFFTLLGLELGVSRSIAIAAAVIYFLLLLGPLRRIVHQSWSLPYVLFCLLMLLRWRREFTWFRTILLGVLFGLLPGIYFWAWTFVWVAAFLVIASMFVEWLQGNRSFDFHRKSGWIIDVTALLVSIPFFVLMYQNSVHPAGPDTALRSSLVHARELESLPRSALLLVFLLLFTVTYWRSEQRKKLLPLLLLAWGAFVVLHQQFVHGLVLSYWTHYYPYVSALSVLTIALLLSLPKRGVTELLTMGLASMFLVGALNDYKGRLSVLTRIPHYEKYQHLSEPLKEFQQMPRSTILSDHDASLIIGTYTDHDLVYTEFLRHVLVSYRELAERSCLVDSMVDRPPDSEWLPSNVEELSAVGREEAARIFLERKGITKEACDWAMTHKADALKKYDVSSMLWDEKNHPEWRVDERLFGLVKRGEGWSVWEVR